MPVFSSHAARSWLVNTHASTASRGRVAPASHSAFMLGLSTEGPRWLAHARPALDIPRPIEPHDSPPHDSDSDIRPPPLSPPIDPATSSTQVVAKVTPKEARRQKRHTKIRSKLSGTPDRPRISVYRSNQHTYVQVIDDENQTTLCAVGTMSPKIKEVIGTEEWKTKTVAAASEVGKALGAMCVEKGIKKAVFDRGGFVYHGRVKAVAEAAREAGMEF